MRTRIFSLLIGAILALSNAGEAWSVKDKIQPPANGLIAFSDAPGSKLGPEPYPDAHIFTVDSNGKNRKQLTKGPGGYLWPVWSPDGDKIACMRLINNTPEIWILDKEGTPQRKITVGFLPAWSPDGKKLAFFRELGNVRQIFVGDLISGTERQLTTQGSNAAAVWSPDGSKIAFWSGDEKGFGQVWVMNSDGSEKKPLTFAQKNDYTPKGSSANVPAWHGEKIAYWAGIEHAYGQIWVMDQNGGNKRQLTKVPAPASNDNPAWSPDGTKLLFDAIRPGGSPEIWVMDADGSHQRILIRNVRVIPARASWQPVRKSK